MREKSESVLVTRVYKMSKFKNIKLNFLSGVPVKDIDFKDILTNLDWEDQETLIRATILHERNVKYPLRNDYQKIFIKHIIQQLESNEVSDIHDKFYEILAEKISECDSEFSYKHFNVVENEFISIKESNSFIRDGTTGLKLWPAAVTLSNYIFNNPDIFNDKSILEIGSGCSGLVGLALLKSSRCKQVFLSDCHDTVVNKLIENINLNLEGYNIENLESSLLIRQHSYVNNSCEMGILNLAWEDIIENQKELMRKCKINMILAADIVYDSSIFKALVSCLKVLFNLYCDSSLQFVLSQTIRNQETFNEFCKLLKVNSFDVTEISIDNLERKIPFANEPLNDVKMYRICQNK
ncbi:unnamed protein product [Chironomus riparius]|uniref:FAM86 N-terminal domain-containing protein n=1 Tax=Chironomus riparius TaxID=315576 RepID=A0A9N9S0D1_9DIPT|nr:unnamed protein product [Chironomus riparius]